MKFNVSSRYLYVLKNGCFVENVKHKIKMRVDQLNREKNLVFYDTREFRLDWKVSSIRIYWDQLFV